MDLRQVQATQAEFDEEFSKVENRHANKVRDISEQIDTLLKQLTTYCEHKENETTHINVPSLSDEIIPELLIQTLRLANMQGVKIEEVFIKKLQEHKQRAKSVQNPAKF